MLIGAFFHAYLQKADASDWLDIARRTEWVTDHDFQAEFAQTRCQEFS